MPAGVLIDRGTPDTTASVYGHGMGTGPVAVVEDDPEPHSSSPAPGGSALARLVNFGGASDAGKSPAGIVAMVPGSSPLLGRCGTAALPVQGPSLASAGGRKSMNMTECVHVASSEHVAEIVGRQGSKIKALRAKTNTYIKTPVRGEDPVFVVTGRKEDVAAAKKEILAIAEHFSQIRAGRLNNSIGGRAPSTLGFFNTDIPGHVTIHVRVPYRVVGLVVGPKGATIKRIQQDSQTYIVTPSRDREPIFEVSGLSENVEKARREIESYIALRTGTGVSDAGLKCNSHPNPMLRPFGGSCELDELPDRELNSQILLGSVFKPDLNGSLASSALSSFHNSLNLGMANKSHMMHGNGVELCGGSNKGLLTANKKVDSLSQNYIGGPNMLNDYTAYSSNKAIERPALPYSNGTLLTNELWSQINKVEAPWLLDGLAAFLPSADEISVLQNETLSGDRNTRTLDSLNFTSSLKMFSNGGDDIERNGEDIGGQLLVNGTGAGYVAKVHSGSVGSSSNSPSVSPTDSVGSPSQCRRRCFVCSDNDIVAALVPCGHNLFCMDCAQAVLDRKDQPESRCPVCQQLASLAVRILS